MQRGKSAVGRSRRVFGVAAVAALALAVGACSSGSSPASTAASEPSTSATGGAASTAAGGAPSPSAPASASADTSFYQGKTMTMIVPGAPGGSFDQWGRLLATYMGQYLHATIKISSIPAGNTIVGQNQLAASPANGLVIGWLNVANDVQLKASNTKGLTFDPTTDLEIVGGVPSGGSGIFVQASSPYKTIADLQKASSPLTAVTVTTGTNALFLRTVLGSYGVKVKYITGYNNTAALGSGFVRGDGVITSIGTDAILDAIKDGKARPIVLAGPPPSGSSVYQQLKDAPTASQLLSQDPPSSETGKEALTALADVTSVGQVVATPKGVPAGELAALTEAMKWAMLQPGLVAAAQKEGLNPGPATPPDTIKANMSTAFEDAATLAPYSSTGA